MSRGRRARRVMEAGGALAPLLQQAGSHAPRARLVVDGQQWVAGDFTVRLGAVTSNSEYRGTLVQVRRLVHLPLLDGGRPCRGVFAACGHALPLAIGW